MTASEPARSEATPGAPVAGRGPSAFARAENTSRRVLVVICGGAFSWGVGSLARVELQEALAAPLEALSTGLSVIAAYWLLHRLWLLVGLAPVSFLAGRFLGGHPVTFVAPAVFTGELLDLALSTLRDGAPFESGEDFTAGVVTLAMASVAPYLAHGLGERAFERARARAVADAAERRADYDAFIARTTAPKGTPRAEGERPPADELTDPAVPPKRE
ncbi:MAG: hypothetical protein INH41_11165 [Myxococcaceae bacterium]|jgi:hypothetical protein|nr:hypothetical protein [Myxococcaceae bacterium]